MFSPLTTHCAANHCRKSRGGKGRNRERQRQTDRDPKTLLSLIKTLLPLIKHSSHPQPTDRPYVFFPNYTQVHTHRSAHSQAFTHTCTQVHKHTRAHMHTEHACTHIRGLTHALGTHPGSYYCIALQAQKELSYPHCINQKFKAAPHHNDLLFPYDENQREATVPSILSGSPRPAQVTPPGSGWRTFSSSIHFLNRTSPPDHKANKNFLARPSSG